MDPNNADATRARRMANVERITEYHAQEKLDAIRQILDSDDSAYERMTRLSHLMSTAYMKAYIEILSEREI